MTKLQGPIVGMGIYVQTYRMFNGFYVPTQVRYEENEHLQAKAEEDWAMTVPADRILCE